MPSNIKMEYDGVNKTFQTSDPKISVFITKLLLQMISLDKQIIINQNISINTTN